MQITGVTGNNNCNYITLSAKSDVGSHVHCDVGYVIKRNSIAIKSDPASFAISLPFFGTFELNILVVAVALRELLVYSHPIPVPPSTLTANIFSVLNPTRCCVYQGLLDIQGICSSGYMYRKGVVGGSLSKY